MTSDLATTVAGEPVELLVDGLLPLLDTLTEPDEHGMCTVDGRLSGESGRAVIRALLRVEADLLRQDADAYVEGAPLPPSPNNRRAHALVELAARIAGPQFSAQPTPGTGAT
jgi:hypothetical protein